MTDQEWWQKALKLEAEDKLAEAEKVIEDAMRPIGAPWPAQFAELYSVRCKRLLAAGKKAEAKAAAARGHDCMLWYASGATSGGEGTALSREAEEYRQGLEKLLRDAGAL